MTFVLLSGATRGIGRAAAIELAKEGAEVALVGRDAERVSAVAQEARAAGGGAPVYNAATGLLQLVSGGVKATLEFENAGLGGGTFHLGTDGGSGVLVIHS